MAITVARTREELYEDVWSQPMLTLARRYGLSDRGLAKLCSRHKIPVPGRGYWRRKQTGKAVVRTPLPRLDNQGSGLIRLGSAEQVEAEEAPNPELPEVDRERSPKHRIVVSSRLTSPHPLVKHARELLAHANEDERGIVSPPAGCLAVRVSPAQRDRALRLMDALIRALEHRGHFVIVDTVNDSRTGSSMYQSVSKTQTIAVVNGERIQFGLEERGKQVQSGKAYGADYAASAARVGSEMPHTISCRLGSSFSKLLGGECMTPGSCGSIARSDELRIA